MLLVACCVLFGVGCLSLVADGVLFGDCPTCVTVACWLFSVACWLLVAGGCSLLVVCYWLFVVRSVLFIV